MLKQNGPVAITHTSGQAVAENNASKGISLPAVSPLQKMDAAMEEPLPEPVPMQMKAHVPPKFILPKTTPVENNVPPPFQLKSGAPVVQRAINILPGPQGPSAFPVNAEPASPHSQGGAKTWNAQQAYARLPAAYRTNVIDQQLLFNILVAMNTQNWSGTGYQNFCQEVANRYKAVLQQQQQPSPEHDTSSDAEDIMEGPDEEGEGQLEEQNQQQGHDFFDEDEMIEDDEEKEEGGKEEIELIEEEEDDVSGEPAYPTGIEKSAMATELDEGDSHYGAEFTTVFTSSSGEAEDLEGIQIKEVVQIGRNDLNAPTAIDTQETIIDDEGGLNDTIATNATRIHSSVPNITNFPAVYETPQTLYWKYPEEDNSAWRLLANIPITVTVIDKSEEGDDERDLRVITTYNGVSVKQRYRGPAVLRP